MNKKIVFTVIVVIFLIIIGLVVAFMRKGDRIENSDVKFEKNAIIEIKENTITNTGLTIIITDTNKNKFGCDQEYVVQKKQDGKWENLKTLEDATFNSIAYYSDDFGKFEQRIDWTNVYGILQKGIYRIQKRIRYENNNEVNLFSEEFTIN